MALAIVLTAGNLVAEPIYRSVTPVEDDAPTDAPASSDASATPGADTPEPDAPLTPSQRYSRDRMSNILEDGISGNPAAVNVSTGTGWLGRTLGVPEDTGVTLGGLYVADANYLFAGGEAPHRTTGNSLLILDFHADLQQGLGWEGASFGSEFLQYNGGPTNGNAGLVQGYNSLEANEPLDRTELYQLWYRQTFLDEKIILRVGKSITTFDFTNVVQPLVLSNSNLTIPSVSALLYTPLYVNSSMLGVLPGYYDAAYGVVLGIAPDDHYYVNLGAYDGSGAKGVHTGNRILPTFDGYYFYIAEAGVAWIAGEDELPGVAAIGGWAQTGWLGEADGPQEDGTQGIYAFGSQQLWWQDPGNSNAGINGFFQFGWNASETLPMNWYVGGGLTALGLIPNRPADSMGLGLAWAGLNQNTFERDTELLTQIYYQAQIYETIFLQPALSFSPAPGGSPEYNAAWAGTIRLIVAF